jgi:DNA repair exonuclease SbcCD nuclease subunit
MRFLHTADWQLGLKLAFVPGDKGAYLRRVRFDTVRAIADVARARHCDAVVVAGDVFDDNAVARYTLELAREALAVFAPIPVLLLPGNHDAATPDCALRKLQGLAHVTPLLEQRPVDVAGARFFPCPLARRHERDDPTRWLPAREAGEGIRVAVAHGGLLDFGESGEAPNRIDAPRVLAKGFDYLALGDWHGLLRFGPRVAYAGTPEPTRFKEKAPGSVLVVDIDAPGSEPRTEVVDVHRARWISREASLACDADLAALESFFAGLEEKSSTLVELTVEGHLSLAGRARLERLLGEQADALAHLRADLERLHDEPSETDIAALEIDGFLGRAVERLRAEATPTSRDALRALHRFVAEERE